MSGRQHGTNLAYEKAGCRCEECRTYQRQRVARSRAQRLAAGRVNHGTAGYSDGCRCQTCTTAHKRRHIDYQERKAHMAGRVSIHGMTTQALRQMRAQLATAVRNAQKRIERIDATLAERGAWPDAPANLGPDQVTRTGRPTEVKHGTDSGYYYHLRHWKTAACTDCRRAHREAAEARKARKLVA